MTASADPTRLDAPNQQVVRPDGSGPADEGTGGAAPAVPDEGTADATAETTSTRGKSRRSTHEDATDEDT